MTDHVTRMSGVYEGLCPESSLSWERSGDDTARPDQASELGNRYYYVERGEPDLERAR